ncbi:MAG: alpha-N-acetylglucosamine transferase [Flavobacteriales bacterium]|jgi:alpha-N-acetylglucosamine transferase
MKNKKYSYISLLSTDDYLPGVLALSKSLELTGAKFPLCVCVIEEISSKVKRILKENNIRIITIEKLSQDNIATRRIWHNTWSKLNVFRLLEFDKIVFLDADTLVCDNLDDLFAKPHMSAVNAGGEVFDDWVNLNSGVMVVEPCLSLFDELIEILESSKTIRGDQCVLIERFPDWAKCSDLLLGHEYNTFVGHLELSKFNLVSGVSEITKDEKPGSVKVIHYSNIKPWGHPKDSEKSPAYKLWDSVYELALTDD